MAFTLRIWFSGLCHFVSNSAEDDARSFRQLCVVLPDARDPEVGTRHRAVMSRPVREKLEDGKFRILYDKTRKRDLVELDQRRVTIFLAEPVGSVDPTYFRFKLDSTIFLPEIAGSFSDEASDIVANRKTEGVLAQVVFDRGIFGVDPLAVVTSAWTLPGFLSGKTQTVTVAEPKHIDVPVRDEVRILVHDLEGDLVREWVVRDGDTDLHEMMVSNRCDEGKALLEWRVEEMHLRLFQLDEDFIHHYRLLSPTTLQSLNQHDRVVEKIEQGDPLIYPVPERLLYDLDLRPFPLGEAWRGLVRGRLRATLGQGEGGRPTLEIDGLGPRGEGPAGWLEEYLDRLPPDLAREVRSLREAVIKAIGSGSGCDCLSCGGKFRFLDERSSAKRAGTFSAPIATLAARPTAIRVEHDAARRSRTLRVADSAAPAGATENRET